MDVSPHAHGNDLRKHIMKRIVLKNYYSPASDPSSAEITSRQSDQESQQNKQLEMDKVLERINREYKNISTEGEQASSTKQAVLPAARPMTIRHSSSMQVIPSKQQEQSTNSVLQRMHSTRLIDESQQGEVSSEEVTKPLGNSIRNRMIQMFRKAIPNGIQEQQEDKFFKQIKAIVQKEDKSEEDIDLLMTTFAPGGSKSSSYLTIIENQYGRPTLRKVLRVLQFVSFPQKKVIIRKGEPADKIFILLGGAAYKVKDNRDRNRNSSGSQQVVSSSLSNPAMQKQSSGSSIGESVSKEGKNSKKKEIRLQGQENTAKIGAVLAVSSERVIDCSASERIVVLPKSETTVGKAGSQMNNSKNNSNRRFSVMQSSDINKQRQEQQQPLICLKGVDTDLNRSSSSSPQKRLSPSKSAQFFSEIDNNNKNNNNNNILPSQPKVSSDCLKIEGIDQIDDSSESCNQSSVSSRQMSAYKIKSGFFQRLQQSPSAMSPLSIFNTPINRLNPKSNNNNLTPNVKNNSGSSDSTPAAARGGSKDDGNASAEKGFNSSIPADEENQETREFFQRGDIFGQLQSTTHKRTVYYSDTVITDRRCEFAVLTMESYQAVVAVLNEDEEKHDKIIDFLSTLQVFQAYNKQTLRQLSFAFTEQTIAKNAFLFKENMPADHLFIAQNGEFVIMRECSFDLSKVQNLDPNRIVKVKENLQICASFPGEFFGEECVLDGQNAKRVFSVKCNTLDSRVLKISKQDLEAFYMSFEAAGISPTEELKSRQLKFSKPTAMEELVEGLQQKRKWRLERFNEMRSKFLKEKRITEDETLSSMINSHFYQKRKEGRNSPLKAISMLVSTAGLGGSGSGGSGGDSPNQLKLRAAHNQFSAKTASFTSAFAAGYFGTHRGSYDGQNDKREGSRESDDSEDDDDNDEEDHEGTKNRKRQQQKQQYGEKKAKTSNSSGSPGILMLQSLNSNKNFNKKKKTISDDSSNNNTPRSIKKLTTRGSENGGHQQQQQEELLYQFSKKLDNSSSDNIISKLHQNTSLDGRSPSSNGKNQLTDQGKSSFVTKKVAESDFSRECARIEKALEIKEKGVNGQLQDAQEIQDNAESSQKPNSYGLKQSSSSKNQNILQQQQQQYYLPAQLSQQNQYTNTNQSSSSGHWNHNSTGDIHNTIQQEHQQLPASYGFRLENKVKLNFTNSNTTKARQQQTNGMQNHQLQVDQDHRDTIAEEDERALKEYYELKNLPISLIFAKSQQQSTTISSDLQHIHESLKRIGIHTPSNMNSPQGKAVSSQEKQGGREQQQQGVLQNNKSNVNRTPMHNNNSSSSNHKNNTGKAKVGLQQQQQQQLQPSAFSKVQGLMSNTPKKRVVLDQKEFLKALRDKNENHNQLNQNKSPFSAENLSSNRSSDGNEYIDIEDKLSSKQTDTVKLHRQVSMQSQPKQQQHSTSYFKQRSLLAGSTSPTGTILTTTAATATTEEAQQYSVAQEKQFLDAMNACAAKYQLVEMNYLESHSAKARKLVAESTQKNQMNLIQKFGEQTAQLHRQQSLFSKKRVFAELYIEKEKKAQQKRDGQMHKMEIDIDDRQSVISHLYQLQQSNAQIFQQKSDPTGCNASSFNFSGMKQRRKFGIVFMPTKDDEEVQQEVQEEEDSDRYNESDSLISQNDDKHAGKQQEQQRVPSASVKSLAILAKLQQNEKDKVNRLQLNSTKRQAALEELKRKCQHNVFMRETLKKQEEIGKAKGKRIDDGNRDDTDDKLKEFLVPQQTLRESNHHPPQTAHSSTRNQVIWKRGISRKQNSEYLRQLVMSESASQLNVDQRSRLQHGGHFHLRESYSFKNSSNSQVMRQSQLMNHTSTTGLHHSRNYQDSFNGGIDGSSNSSGISDITKPYQHINLQRISSTSLYNSQWDSSKKQLIFNRLKTYNP